MISGSDQIFNTTITNNSKAYYLFFDNCGKKISYASSFGRDEISLKEIEYIKSELPKFNALSVREKNAGELIKLHTGISPLQVLDPVFLLNRYEWGMIEKDVSGLPKKYIFVYAMEFSENLERTIRIVRQQFGFPVIVKVGGASANRLPYKKINCDPAQFLYLLNKASIVITNSFHGMAFAFIYGKKFYAVAHSKRNARLDNLMTLAGFREKIISSNDNISESEIDGLRAYKKIIPYIESSKKYLEINLK